MDRCELAYNYFYNGCNCAQAVVCAFADKIGLSLDICKAVSCGFGGGVGGSRAEICGAASGAVIVLNMLYPHTDNSAEGKKLTYSKAYNFRERFLSAFQTTRCDKLKESGITATEKTPAAQRMELTKCCDILVVTAIEIVEAILAEA